MTNAQRTVDAQPLRRCPTIESQRKSALPLANDADNNGNGRRALHYVPLNDAISNYVVPQLADYSYDALNRITNYTETQYNGSAWVSNVAGQTCSYDRYGNRQIRTSLGGVTGYSKTCISRLSITFDSGREYIAVDGNLPLHRTDSHAAKRLMKRTPMPCANATM